MWRYIIILQIYAAWWWLLWCSRNMWLPFCYFQLVHGRVTVYYYVFLRHDGNTTPKKIRVYFYYIKSWNVNAFYRFMFFMLHFFYCCVLGSQENYWHNLGRDSEMLKKGKSDHIHALAALTSGNSVLYQMDSKFDMPQLLCTRWRRQVCCSTAGNTEFGAVLEFFQSHVIVILSCD
jgi:hypothetical protein